MNKPINTRDLFNKIYEILKNKDRIPGILEYGSPAFNPVSLTNWNFDLKNNLDYGSSEGIYLDLWADYHSDGEIRKISIGTFKTLQDDQEAMRAMGMLLADFIVELYDYVHKNPDVFTWEGFNLYPLDASGKKLSWHCTFDNVSDALKMKDNLLEKYSYVCIRNNATRHADIYSKPEGEISFADH